MGESECGERKNCWKKNGKEEVKVVKKSSPETQSGNADVCKSVCAAR